MFLDFIKSLFFEEKKELQNLKYVNHHGIYITN